MDHLSMNQSFDFTSRLRVERQRSRFHDLYSSFCEELGQPPLAFAQHNDFMFNLFELYCCVVWHGGFNKVCFDSKWHRIAYVLCRATKRQKGAAKAAKLCFKERLVAFAQHLESLCETSPQDQNGNPLESCLKRMKMEVSLNPRPTMRCLRSRLGREDPSVKQRQPVQWGLRTSFDVVTYLPLPRSLTSEAIKCIAPQRGTLQRSTILQSQFTEVDDIVQGDTLRSALSWVRSFARDPSSKMDPIEDLYHFRYSGELLRMRQKLNRNFKRETISIKQSQVESEEEDSESDKDIEDVKDADVRCGPQFQAEIPPFRPLSNTTPSPYWNTTPIHLNERPLRKQRRDERGKVLRTQEARLEWMDRCSENLRMTLGASSLALGLSSMGNRLRSTWNTEQEQRFASGIALHGRAFDEIREEFLPEKTTADLVLYYYNIWKQRRTPAAERWYREKRQKILDQEKADQQRQQEIKTRNRIQAAEGRQRRLDRKQQKKLEDALSWVRSLAKNPENVRTVRGHLFYSPAQRMASLYRDGVIQLPP